MLRQAGLIVLRKICNCSTVVFMNALQAFKKIERAATVLAWGWVLNNLLGLVSIIVLIYLIWWQWLLGIWGVLALLIGIWVVNSVLLPALFSMLNKPFAEMAKAGAVRLAVLKVIDDDIVKKLADTKVEYWPNVIASSLSQEDFEKKILLTSIIEPPS